MPTEQDELLEQALKQDLQFSAASALVQRLLQSLPSRDQDRELLFKNICARWRNPTIPIERTYHPDHVHDNLALDCRLALLGAACREGQSSGVSNLNKAKLALQELLGNSPGQLMTGPYRVYGEAVDLLCEAWQPHLCGHWHISHIREHEIIDAPRIVQLSGACWSICSVELPPAVTWSHDYKGFVARTG